MLRLSIWFAIGCAAPPSQTGTTAAQRYLGDAAFRRAAMLDELVTTDNGYGQLRVDHYARDWDALEAWNPPTTSEPLVLDEAIADDSIQLAELGALAFTRYPVQLWSVVPPGSRGLVEVALDPPRIAATCSTCHSTATTPGLANAALDLGWGPGRVDVTTSDGHEPVRIPDLRPVALTPYLHADGNVRNTDVIALAIRIETLIITSHAQAVRPPRLVALALATYLETLVPTSTPSAGRGADVFADNCAGCHDGGPPIALAAIGTDPIVGESLERGTGTYAVPSLVGVAQRTLLLHDGSVSSIDELLDPDRTSPGHHIELAADDRAALVAFLRTL